MTGDGPAGRSPVRRAVVVADTPEANLVVGGLPLAVRVVLALTRAGATDITLFGGAMADRVLEAVTARGLRPGRWPADAELPDAARDEGDAPVLLVDGRALLHGVTLPVVEGGAPEVPLRLGGEGGPPPAILCGVAALGSLLAAVGGGVSDLDRAVTRAGWPRLPDGGPLATLVRVVRDGAGRRAAETVLLDHLRGHTRDADGFLAARIDRNLSRPLTRWLLPWPVSPGQLTLAGLALGLVGAGGLAAATYRSQLLGALALVGSLVVDDVDGEVARARLEDSGAGARLDLAVDYIVHLSVFLGLAVGLARGGLPPGGLAALLTLVSGVVVAMMLVHRRLIGPALATRGDLHPQGGGPRPRLDVVVGKVASRDYTYLLLVLAAAGRLEWFLYPAAAGAWLFALAVVLLGRIPDRGGAGSWDLPGPGAVLSSKPWRERP